MKTKTRTTRKRDRGSALLVSLMVIAGLSLLGLGFIAISETESTISINERNYTQTLQVAETGARAVAEWFNNPQWARANGLMPANATTIKQERHTATASGYYKPNTAADLLCDIPFAQFEDRLWAADANSADIVITRTNAQAFIDGFNQRLFNDNNEGGRITEIRLYGPPVVAGQVYTHAASGRRYWNPGAGTRYGLATIAVTAEKRRNNAVPGGLGSPLIARRTVRIVVAELPLPGAEGPLQSHSGTGTTGNFRVHWAKAISNGDIAVKRLHTTLPWESAWTRIRFEEGYAPSYNTAAVDYLYELIDKQFEDPWFEVRGRGTSTAPPGSPATSGGTQLWPYASVNDVETAVGVAGYSANFQNQTEDNLALNKKNVLFTRPVYEIWKQIALAGAGQQGIYYLRYVSGSGYDSMWRDTRGISKEFRDWVNVYRGGGEGFFFFDTTDGSNPQLPNGATNTTVLTPSISLSASAGNPFKMKGFFFMNMVAFGSTGLKDTSGAEFYNYPGEPFQDLGYHKVDRTTGKLLCTVGTNPAEVACDTAGAGATPKLENYTNRVWDYFDVDEDGAFDYFVAQNAAAITTPGTDSADFAASTRWFIVPYFDGCSVGVNCSEPHEPYLNLIYPYPNALQSGGNPELLTVRWEDPSSETRRAIKKDSSGAPITCTSTSTYDECTSNRYDREGPLVRPATGTGDGPILEGIIYNEGNYDAAGSAIFYGAVLIQGGVTGSGSPIVFFDESLARGDWAKKLVNLPRTIMTTIETDQ